LDYDRAAAILVEAAYRGDDETVKKWGVSRQSIYNYRNRLENDPKLLHTFTLLKKEYDTNWANDIPAAIRSGIDFLGRASKEADPKDPDAIHAVAGAVKILAEVGMTKAILDVRLGGLFGEDGAEDRPMDTAPKKLQATN
jgi:hypothetical protein